MNKNFEPMRRQYMESGLRETEMASDPFTQFAEWFDAADESKPGEWFETNAMTLSTADATGRVSSRIVLLKGASSAGLLFFTNYESAKGGDIELNPHGALNFYWPHVERQVRVEGTIEKTSTEVSLAYFHSRPFGSQIGALASKQSSVVPSREVLEQRFKELEQEYEGQEVPLPKNWGGYCLQPTMIEFWQGRANRLHDRLRYTLADGHWNLIRLSP